MQKLLIAILFAVCGLLTVWLIRERRHDSTPAMERDTVTVIVRDTVTVVKPQPIAVSSVGLQRVTLPLWRDSERSTDSVAIARNDNLSSSDYNLSAHGADSVEVALPIERRVYEDSTFRAVVSGAFASLDSITVYPRREIQRITIRQRPRRWGLGVSVGYGVTRNGIEPFIGIGVTYLFF